MDKPEYYTKREVADILRVDTRTVERMIENGRVSSTKPHGKVLVPVSEIHGLLSENWTPADPPE